MFNSKKYKIKQLVLLFEIISFIGLSISYYFIADFYSYMGFKWGFDLSRFLVGLSFLIIIEFLGRNIKNKFVYAVWHIILIYYLFGQIIFYQYYPDSSIKPLIANSIFIIVLLMMDFLKIRIKSRLFDLETNKNNRLFLFALAILFFIPFLLYLPYINLKNIFFIDIYKTRMLFREISIKPLGYILPPLARIILPVIILIGIKHKKRIVWQLASLMLIYLFLCGAVKSVFIGLFSAIIFFYGDYEKKPLIFGVIVSFLTFFGLIILFVTGNPFLIDSFIRRVFFVPPYLDSYYYDFFNNNYIYWAHSSIGKWIADYPYDKSITFYVGENLLKKEGLNANVGVITEGFFSFGFIGVIIHSFAVMLILTYLKSLRINNDYFGIIFIYLYYFNTAMFGILTVTHGLLFLLLFFTFFLKDSSKEYM